MPGFFRGETFRKAKAAASGPWADVYDLASADGWLALFDPTNPATRTLRSSGGTDYVAAIADGLGNWPDVLQASDALQPPLVPGHFGDLDGMAFDGSSTAMRGASSVTPISQPNIIVQVRQLSTLDDYRFNISVTGRTSGYENHCYVESFFWGGYPGIFAGGGLVGGPRTLEPVVFGGLFNGSTSKTFRNGAELASGNAGTRSIDGLSLGVNVVGSDSQHWPGWIGPTLVRADGNETAMTDMVSLLSGLMA